MSEVADHDLPERLNLAITRLSRQIRQGALSGLSPTQQATLSNLEHASKTLGELAALERVQPPTMTVIVDRLEKQGVVRRRPDPDDRRVVRVEITAAGRNLRARNRADRGALIARRLEVLTPAQREVLSTAVDLLNALVEHEDDSGNEAERPPDSGEPEDRTDVPVGS